MNRRINGQGGWGIDAIDQVDARLPVGIYSLAIPTDYAREAEGGTTHTPLALSWPCGPGR